eukprot:TRINITY_DN4768_c0_g1_i2.p1 TRINITY_DN4768_c0_g1~~TRINITY_DN4768_c0_g1_i2.p1  ORF type:complete len:1097 (-),score=201.58 TRINITY_DN4768_c0_g1_i2:86-3376(-)
MGAGSSVKSSEDGAAATFRQGDQADLEQRLRERDRQLAELSATVERLKRGLAKPGVGPASGAAASGELGSTDPLPTGDFRPSEESPNTIDLLFCHVESGAAAARTLNDRFLDLCERKPRTQAHLFSSPETALTPERKTLLEQTATGCKMIALVMTQAIFDRGDVRYLLRCALHYNRKVELVHVVEEAPFPSDSSVPPYLHSLFNAKSISYLGDYVETAAQQLHTRFVNSVGERAVALAQGSAAVKQLHVHPVFLIRIGEFGCAGCQSVFPNESALRCIRQDCQTPYCIQCAQAAVALLPAERLESDHEHPLVKGGPGAQFACSKCATTDNIGLCFRCTECEHVRCIPCSYGALRLGQAVDSVSVSGAHQHVLKLKTKIQHHALEDYECAGCEKKHRRTRYECDRCRQLFCLFCVPSLASGQPLPEFVADEDPHVIHKAVFLSHKRSSGQAVAGRLFEGLKADFDCFLDSEARFKIHDLEEIVRRCDTFVFIMTDGILQSEWCLKELRAAISGRKPIVVVRHIEYPIPKAWPEGMQDVGPAIEKAPKVVWMAEFNQECINKLKRQYLGPRTVDQDAFFKDAWESLDFASSPESRELVSWTYDPVKMQLDLDACIYCSAYYFPGAAGKTKKVQVDVSDQPLEQHIRMDHVRHRMPELPALRTLEANWRHSLAFLLQYQSHYYDQIEKLKLGNVGDVNSVWQLVSKLPRLRSLTFLSADLKTLPPVQPVLHQIDQLKIILMYSDPAQAEVEALLNVCPNLNSLVLKSLYGIGPSVLEVAANACTGITKLEADTEMLGDRWLEALGRFSKLESFKVQDFCFVQDVSPQPAVMPTLRRVFFQTCDVPENVDSIGRFLSLSPSVRRADFVRPKSLPEEVVVLLADSWANLEVLVLLAELTDDGLTALGRCPSLQRLQVTRVENISDVGVSGFAAAAAGIRTLDFRACVSLTDASAEAIAKHCQKLEELDVTGSKVGDAGVCALVAGCPSLSKLRLGSCPITDAALPKIATLEKLEHLYLKNCIAITDPGLLCLTSCQRLRYLSLKHIRGLTDQTAVELLEKCPELWRVRVGDYALSRTVTERALQRSYAYPTMRNSDSWKNY